MASRAGQKFLLQTPSDEAKAVQDAAPSDGDFTTVAGMQTVTGDLTATEIDVTNQSSGENRELLDAHGIRAFTISGTGIMQDSAMQKALETTYANQKLRWFRIKQDDVTTGVITRVAKFKISSFNITGVYDNAITFNMTLMSSGAVTRT